MTERPFDILVIDEEPLVAETSVRIFSLYREISVRSAIGASAALVEFEKKVPDVIIVEKCLSYGDAWEKLDPGHIDWFQVNTGIRLLKYFFAQQEKFAGSKKLHVFFMHTCSHLFSPGDIAWLESKQVFFYTKPFDTFLLEQEVCECLGIESLVRPEFLINREQSRAKMNTRTRFYRQ